MTLESRTHHCTTANNWKEKSTRTGDLFVSLNSNKKNIEQFWINPIKTIILGYNVLFGLNYKLSTAFQ